MAYRQNIGGGSTFRTIQIFFLLLKQTKIKWYDTFPKPLKIIFTLTILMTFSFHNLCPYDIQFDTTGMSEKIVQKLCGN